ncbi:MAG TPA: EthD family reductase [Burkholderiales bacterium]|nr:EthD family reductase [Burkholderiales bacterium]
MTKISILYPARAGARFDFAYYVGNHMPMSIGRLSAHPGFRGVSVERGLTSLPGTQSVYAAMCHFLFTSLADFLAAFEPHAALLQGDLVNYTDIRPLIQVSEVLIAQPG